MPMWSKTRGVPVVFAVFAWWLCGCGTVSTNSLPGSGQTAATSAGTSSGGGLVTTVHGRAQSGPAAVAGSRIYVLAANTAGYGAKSVSLLDAGAPGVMTDATGSYVLTDGNGGFSIGGIYSCTPNQLVYVLAMGGRTVGTEADNPGLALLSLLGVCPDAGNFSGVIQFLNIGEVSTVASVYSLAGFMTDGAHISSAATAQSFRGMMNAFATASNIYDASSGQSLAQTPAGSGIVPQAEINTLANMLAPCVNAPAMCGTLFNLAKAADGTVPMDTVSALLNIAKNPGANVAALYGIAKGTQAFLPALEAAPNDWTVAVTIYAENLAGAYFPAFDSMGNLWVPGYANNTLTEFDPQGNMLSGESGFSGGGLNQPYAVAIDGRDNAWVTNYAAGTGGTTVVSEFNAGGTPVAANGYSCGTKCTSAAVDGLGNVWVSGSPQIQTVRSSGVAISSFSTNSFGSGVAVDSRGRGWVIGQGQHLYRLTLPGQTETFAESVTAASGMEVTPVAIDGGDNVWFASSQRSSLGKHDGNGVAVSPAGGFTGGGLKGPAGLAVDGANTVWVANREGNSISQFTNAGVAVSPATGYRGAGVSHPRGIAVDPSGNVWVANFTGNSVTEFVGLGAPTVTPVMPGSHGQRP